MSNRSQQPPPQGRRPETPTGDKAPRRPRRVPRRLLIDLTLVSVLSPLLWMAARAADHDKDAGAKPPATEKKEGNADEHRDEHRDEHKDEHKDEVALTPEAIRRYGVRTGVARKHKLVSTFVAPARVSLNAEATAVVGSPVSGRVAEVKVRVGDEVRKGDELLAVESPELAEAQSDYLQKRAALGGAEAVVEPAKGAAERARLLFDKSQGISLAELQKRELEYATARHNLLVARAAADAAVSRLSLLGFDAKAIEQLEQTKKINPRYAVRAPIGGVVTERPVNLGELVKPDREKLLALADTSTLWVLADVPEARLREVATGSKAAVSLGAPGAPGGQTYEGTVSSVALAVDPATRTVPVRIEVKGDPLLKPGMFAQVEITAKSADDEPVLAVPDAAVQTVEGSAAVFMPVKGEPNTFALRHVKVGPVVGGMVPVVSGLEENERIVTAGTFILKADLGKAGAKDED